jgi:fibronectin type 3 domain-containing protein
MKKNRLFGMVILIVGIMLVFAFTACDIPNSEKDEKSNGNGNTTQTPTAADFTISGTGTVYFDGDYKSATVTPKSGKTTGAVTVYYEGTGSTEYEKKVTAPYGFGTYAVTFDVAAATSWNEASGLSAGTLTVSDGTPGTPSAVSIAVASATSARVSWSAVTRAASYKVYYITEDMEELALAGTVTGNSYTHTGLTANKIYYYYITAVNTYGESNYSTFKAVKIGTPDVPAQVDAEATSGSRINLRWSSVTGASSYKVYYSTSLSGEKLSWANNTYTTASCGVTGCTPNTTYYFFVKAVNAIGESDYSPAGSAKTFAGGASGAPTNVTAELWKEMNWIRVSWKKSSATYYSIYYTTGSPDNPKSLAVGFIPLDNDYITNTKSNTTYYIWVAAQSGPYGGGPEYLSEMVVVGTGNPPPPPPPTPPSSALTTEPEKSSKGTKICTFKFCANGECYSPYTFSGDIERGPCVNGRYSHSKEICVICKGTGVCKICNGTGKI